MLRACVIRLAGGRRGAFLAALGLAAALPIAAAAGKTAPLPDLPALARSFAPPILKDGRAGTLPARLAAAGLLIDASAPKDLDAVRLGLNAAAEELAKTPDQAAAPMKRRLAESLARLMVAEAPDRLLRRYRQERNPLIRDALYIALCRNGGPREGEFLANHFNPRRAAALAAYLARLRPQALRSLYDGWRGASAANEPVRPLVALAVAAHGRREDARSLYALAARASDPRDAEILSRAAADLLARLRAYDLVAIDVRSTLKQALEKPTSARTLAAVRAAAVGGGREELNALERIIHPRASSENIGRQELRAEAALAWAKLIDRLGLVDEALTRGALHWQSLPLLRVMLLHPSPIVNAAALEALRLRLRRERPRALSAEELRLAADWGRLFGRILEQLLGCPFSLEAKPLVGSQEGGSFVLRPAAKVAPPRRDGRDRVQELLSLLLCLRQKPEAERREALKRLASIWNFDDLPGAYRCLDELVGRGARFVWDRKTARLHLNLGPTSSQP